MLLFSAVSIFACTNRPIHKHGFAETIFASFFIKHSSNFIAFSWKNIFIVFLFLGKMRLKFLKISDAMKNRLHSMFMKLDAELFDFNLPTTACNTLNEIDPACTQFHH